jgi:TDG/mug DNA glycosylase family protein
VAVVGIGAYRIAFARPKALLGRQPETLAGAILWVLPNTSGLNANHQAADFARAFRELARAVPRQPGASRKPQPPSRAP